MASRSIAHLSPRQRQIVQLLAEGQSDKEIARRLGLSAATVRTYLQRLYAQHGLRNRVHTVSVAMRSRWLQLANDESAESSTESGC